MKLVPDPCSSAAGEEKRKLAFNTPLFVLMFLSIYTYIFIHKPLSLALCLKPPAKTSSLLELLHILKWIQSVCNKV